MTRLLFSLSLLITLIITPLTLAIAATPHEFHNPQKFAESLKQSKNQGEKVFNAYCAVCHAKNPAISLGAPRMDTEDWKPRLKLRNVEEMLKKIDAGFNAMPPRGGCFECSDKELKAAIEFMLPKDH